jgi:hypothetical protein
MNHIRQDRLAGRELGDTRVRRVTGWVAGGCASLAAALALLLPGAPAAASPPSAEDPLASEPVGVAGGNEAEGAAPLSPAPAAASGAPDTGAQRQLPRRHHQVPQQVIQPPAQAPTYTSSPRSHSHARSGAS